MHSITSTQSTNYTFVFDQYPCARLMSRYMPRFAHHNYDTDTGPNPSRPHLHHYPQPPRTLATSHEPPAPIPYTQLALRLFNGCAQLDTPRMTNLADAMYHVHMMCLKRMCIAVYLPYGYMACFCFETTISATVHSIHPKLSQTGSGLATSSSIDR